MAERAWAFKRIVNNVNNCHDKVKAIFVKGSIEGYIYKSPLSIYKTYRKLMGH